MAKKSKQTQEMDLGEGLNKVPDVVDCLFGYTQVAPEKYVAISIIYGTYNCLTPNRERGESKALTVQRMLQAMREHAARRDT